MKVLIDADGCPVTNEALAIAKKYGVEVVLICDTAHEMEREGARTVMTDKGSDAADFVLVNLVQKGDLVLTQDYGLATMVLAKNGYAMNQNGMSYNEGNIDRLLFTRHLGKEVRRKGGRTKGPKKRTSEQDAQFEQAFEALLRKVLGI